MLNDQVQRLLFRRFTVDLAQQLQPLPVAMTLLALSDDLPLEHIDGRE